MMIHDLRQSFTQAALGSIIWVFLLGTIAYQGLDIPFNYVWNLIGIGVISGIIFGIIYPYLWGYATFKAPVNIILSTLINSFGGLLVVYLFSADMFGSIKKYIVLFILLTLIGHIIAFYFYSKYQNKKLADSLNDLKNKK
jgi:FlaA1/EpsC-like NDP-sugar epimerase